MGLARPLFGRGKMRLDDSRSRCSLPRPCTTKKRSHELFYFGRIRAPSSRSHVRSAPPRSRPRGRSETRLSCWRSPLAFQGLPEWLVHPMSIAAHCRSIHNASRLERFRRAGSVLCAGRVTNWRTTRGSSRTRAQRFLRRHAAGARDGRISAFLIYDQARTGEVSPWGRKTVWVARGLRVEAKQKPGPQLQTPCPFGPVTAMSRSSLEPRPHAAGRRSS